MYLKAGDVSRCSIWGQNFDGQIILNGSKLQINCTEFKKGGMYNLIVDDTTLAKDYKRYLFFSKALDLFTAISKNKQLDINDEGSLIMPIEIMYEQKMYPLKIDIALTHIKFQTDAEEKQKLYQQLARMSKHKISLEKYIQKQYSFINSIKFKGDEANPFFDKYQLSNNGSVIKKIDDKVWQIYNHYKPLPISGSYYFKAKILKINSDLNMMFGVCGKCITGNINADTYGSNSFIGLQFYKGHVYMNKTSKIMASNFEIIEGKSIVRVLVDMDIKSIKWFLNEKVLCSVLFNSEMTNIDVYMMVNLYSAGNSIEFMND